MTHPVLVQLKDVLGDSIRIIKIDADKNESLSMTHLMIYHGDHGWKLEQ